MKENELNKTKLIAIVILLVSGICLIYLGYNKKKNISSYSLEDTAITVIDLTDKSEDLNKLPLVLGTGLVLIALFLLIKTYLSSTQPKLKTTDKLTTQEKRIVTFIQEGRTNKEIAIELSISPSTVKTHINNVYKKLEVNSRAEIHQIC